MAGLAGGVMPIYSKSALRYPCLKCISSISNFSHFRNLPPSAFCLFLVRSCSFCVVLAVRCYGFALFCCTIENRGRLGVLFILGLLHFGAGFGVWRCGMGPHYIPQREFQQGVLKDGVVAGIGAGLHQVEEAVEGEFGQVRGVHSG